MTRFDTRLLVICGLILFGVALAAICPLIALAQRAQERTAEQELLLEARQRQLGTLAGAASREVDAERARRLAPFDLLWGAE